MGWKESAGYQLYEQKERSSCGMASVAMVVNRKDGSQPTESMLAGKSTKMARGYRQALGDRFKGQPRMLTATSDPTPSDGYEGTYIDNLSALLADWKIVNDCSYRGDVMSTLRGVRSGSPAIAQVDWSGGGSHFVLIEKYMAGAPKGLVVCDPFYGVTAVDASGAATYTTADGTVGRFNGWVITT